VIPIEQEVLQHQYESPNKWTTHLPVIEELKDKVKAAGLFNLFMNPHCDPEGRCVATASHHTPQTRPFSRPGQCVTVFYWRCRYGRGFTNFEYAPMCEEMGRSLVAPELFNCAAPDTGNMGRLVVGVGLTPASAHL